MIKISIGIRYCRDNKSQLKNLASSIFNSMSEDIENLQKHVETQAKELAKRLSEVEHDSSDRDSKISSSLPFIFTMGQMV